MVRRQLFVFGVARGGTNLVARVLAAHPAVAMGMDPLMPLLRFWRDCVMAEAAPGLTMPRPAGEPFRDFYFDADGPAMLEAMLAGRADYPVPAGLLPQLREALAARAELESPSLARHLAGVEARDVAGLAAAVLEAVAAEAREAGAAPPAWLGCKEVWTIDFLPMLARAFPEARFVIVLRDPRAVLASLLAMAAGDPTQRAHGVSYLRHWRKLVALAARFRATPDLAPRVTVARFESICHAPEAEARRLSDFLGLAFAPSMLAPGGENGWRGNSSFGEIGSGISPGAADGWRRRITEADRALAEFLCAPEMAATGYDLAGAEFEPTPAVIGRMLDFHDDPGSWRSDSGDPFADLAWETLRHRLWRVVPPAPRTETLMARCFLYPPVLQQQRTQE